MGSDELQLSIVIPAYREEENLKILLPAISRVLREIGVASEVLIIDTEVSLDNTRDLVKEVGFRYVNRLGGNRYGDAVRTGITESRGSFILFMDADGSHPPDFIRVLYDLHRVSEVVVASRYVKGGTSENSAISIWMSRIVNNVYGLVLGIPCLDISNSFKLYRGSFLRGLKLKCQNFDIIEEMVFRGVQRNRYARITEVPLNFANRMFGESKRNTLLFILTYIVTILRLRFLR